LQNKQSYLTYKFCGVRPFAFSLKQAGIEFEIFSDENANELRKLKPDLFTHEKDIINIGKCTKDDKILYFVEFGIMIDDTLRSFITFIYDHHPDLAEIEQAADDMEPLTIGSLNKVKEEQSENIN